MKIRMHFLFTRWATISFHSMLVFTKDGSTFITPICRCIVGVFPMQTMAHHFPLLYIYIQLYELLYWGLYNNTFITNTPHRHPKKNYYQPPNKKNTTFSWPTDHPPNPKGAAPLALLFDLLALDSRLRHHRRALTPQEKAEVVRSVAGEVQRGSETAPSAAPWCLGGQLEDLRWLSYIWYHMIFWNEGCSKEYHEFEGNKTTSKW